MTNPSENVPKEYVMSQRISSSGGMFFEAIDVGTNCRISLAHALKCLCRDGHERRFRRQAGHGAHLQFQLRHLREDEFLQMQGFDIFGFVGF
jgi:hypothetical protein